MIIEDNLMNNRIEDLSGKKTTQLNVSMSLDDKIFLKTYAAKQNTSVAAIIHEWIERARKEKTPNGEERSEN